MAQAKGQQKGQPETPDTPKVVVVLPTASAKKHSVRYETDEKGAQVTNIYLGLDGCRILGNPDKVKITVEPYAPEA